MTVILPSVLLVIFAVLLPLFNGYAISRQLPGQRGSNRLLTPSLLQTHHGATNFASFPDATKIKLVDDESGHKAEYRVDLPVTGDEAPSEQLWKWWSDKRIQEEALKRAIVGGKTGADLKPVFDEYAKYLVHDKVEVLNTNMRYFEALRTGDMNTLQALWLNAESTVCVTNSYFKGHLESANVIGGFRNISNYYAKHTPTMLEYQLEDINLMYYGDAAVVSCTVHAHKPGRRVKDSKALTIGAPQLSYYVTNVFKRPFGSDRYFLHTHMSSLSPAVSGASSSSGAKTRTGSGSGGADGARRRKISAVQRATYKDPTRTKAPSRQEGFALQQLGRFFGGTGPGRNFGNTRRFSGPGSEDPDSDEDENQEEIEELVDDITGEHLDPDGYFSGEDEGENDDEADEEEGENDSESDGEGGDAEEPLFVITEDGRRRMQGFAGNNKKASASSKNNNNRIPSPAEEESQLRMNRLKDAILRTLSNLSSQRGPGGMGGVRNGMFIVTSNDPASLHSAANKNAKSGADSDNPLRALDAVMRGLPPSSVSQPSAGDLPILPRTNGVSGAIAGGTYDSVGNGASDSTDEEDREDQEQAAMKALAARSLEALRHLCSTQQLSSAQKTVLSSDVIQCLSQGMYSQVEMAYALLILGARPDESLLVEDLLSLGPGASSSSVDLTEVSAEDMADFAAFCHTYAAQLSAPRPSA